MIFEGIEVAVVRKPVKNIRLSVLSDCTLRVVAPGGYDVSRILSEKRDWIFDHIEKKRINLDKSLEKSSFMLYSGNFFEVSAGDSCSFNYESMTVSYSSVNSLREYLKNRLREDLKTRLCEISGLMGVSYKSFSIRKQKTRWASCSARGTLNFNIRIAALPPHLRDYIIVHELAHITEHNHSAKFWDIVEKYCPDYKKYRKELSDNWIIIENSRIWITLLK